MKELIYNKILMLAVFLILTGCMKTTETVNNAYTRGVNDYAQRNYFQQENLEKYIAIGSQAKTHPSEEWSVVIPNNSSTPDGRELIKNDKVIYVEE